MFEEINDYELEKAFIGDAYKLYWDDIKGFPKLSVERQKELGKRIINDNDNDAWQELFNCNLKLVIAIAHKYREKLKHLDIMDIIQEGNFGLLRALEDYNPEEGAFTTHATSWIKQKILRGIANTNEEIRKPVHMIDAINKYNQLIAQYNKRGELIPNDKELCKLLNISFSSLKQVREIINQQTISMNKPINDDDRETEFGKLIADNNDQYDQVLDKIVNNELLLVLKELLDPLRYFIIYHRIINENEKTLEEVAKYFNVTRERIRQLEFKTIEKVKSYLEDSKKMKSILNKIKSKAKYNFSRIKTEPLNPTNIIKFLYLKDELSLDEREIYKLSLLGKYKYTIEEYADTLKLSVTETEGIIESLKLKIQKRFNNINLYKSFEETMIKTYGTKIFSIINNEHSDDIDYGYIRSTYFNMSFQDILDLASETNYELSSDAKNLLERFFSQEDLKLFNPSKIEKDVNLAKFRVNERKTRHNLKNLYLAYLNNKNDFTEEQQIFLETFIFNVRDQRDYVKTKIRYKSYYLIEIIESYHYNIHNFKDTNFSLDKWNKVKKSHNSLFSELEIEMLDLYYGKNGRRYNISELAKHFNMDYIKTHSICRNARDYAVSLYCGTYRSLNIDKKVYIPYILDNSYFFTEETRNILKLFLVEEKNYDEIQALTKLNKYRISNIITDGIRKIDYYRFGISEVFNISEDALNMFFNEYKESDIVKRIIKLKYLDKIDNESISKIVNLPIITINRYVRKFNLKYETYITKDVKLTIRDVEEEINRHLSESILSAELKELASYYYGIKNNYNPQGLKLSSNQLMEKYDLKETKYRNILHKTNRLIKCRKVGFQKPEILYFSRAQLNELLDDLHLPISSKEKEIICHLFELKNYPLMTLDELANKYKINKSSIRRRYQRAIINIYKYVNHEIDGIINFEQDIKPILKYFAISDRAKIIDIYQNKLTYEEMANKYHLTKAQITCIAYRIRNNINDILYHDNAKMFDFDYYLEAIKNPKLPFYGDLDLAIKVFDMYYGMNGNSVSVPEICEKLSLNYGYSTINYIIRKLMISVCKLRDGIIKDELFSYDEVLNYYKQHQFQMNDKTRKLYESYFSSIKKNRSVTGKRITISDYIINDLIKENYKDAFNIESSTKEEIIDIIRNVELSKRTKIGLLQFIGMSERNLMNGKDLNHVYRILNTIDTLKKDLNAKPRMLIQS